MICENCGKQNAKIKKVSRSYGKGNELFVLDNIPVIYCPDCKENLLTSKTMHEIERLKKYKKSLKSKKMVPVINYK